MNNLQELELLEVENMQEEQKNVFVIKDINGLNWVLRKIGAINAKLKEIKSLADSERQRIDEWEKKESADLKNDISFFEHKVFEYHMQVLQENPKEKSISTPYGKVKSTTRSAQPEKADESSIFDYVEQNELSFVDVQTVKKLNWAELKKTLTVVEKENGEQVVIDSNGQLVPGVSVKPSETTFKVEVVE